MASFSFPSFDRRGFIAGPRGFRTEEFNAASLGARSNFRRDSSIKRPARSRMFSVGSDATDDFSVDRSYLNSAPVRENTPRFGGPSRTRPSSIEQVSNSRFNERPGFGQSSMSNRPADRNPDSPGRGFAFGRNKDKGRDNPGRGNAFGRDKDNKDERKAQRKAERRERMKGELLDKAKRKKREKRGRERD